MDRFRVAAGVGAGRRAGGGGVDAARHGGDIDDVLCRRAESSCTGPRPPTIANLEADAPPLWVVLRPTGAEPPYESSAVTADPAEGEALTEAGGNLVETVPMPDAIRRDRGGIRRRAPRRAAVLQRKRDRADPEALARRAPILRGGTNERARQLPDAMVTAQAGCGEKPLSRPSRTPSLAIRPSPGDVPERPRGAVAARVSLLQSRRPQSRRNRDPTSRNCPRSIRSPRRAIFAPSGAGAPAALTRAALRRAWVADPGDPGFRRACRLRLGLQYTGGDHRLSAARDD